MRRLTLCQPFYQKPTPGILIKPRKNDNKQSYGRLRSKKVTIAPMEGDDETEANTIVTFIVDDLEEEEEYVRVQRDRYEACCFHSFWLKPSSMRFQTYTTSSCRIFGCRCM